MIKVRQDSHKTHIMVLYQGGHFGNFTLAPQLPGPPGPNQPNQHNL